MAAITWTDVTNHFSTLSGVSTGARIDILAYVNGYGIAVSRFDGESGNMTKLARVYLAGHYGALELRGGAGGAGQVTQMSEGGVSISFAQPQSSSDPVLGTTPGGVAFKNLIQRAPRLRGMIIA